MNYHQAFAEELAAHLKGILDVHEIASLLEEPKYITHGDLAFPCFTLAKKLKKAPQQIAKDLSEKIAAPFLEKTMAEGPYVNGFLNKEIVSKQVIERINKEQESYSSLSLGNGKTITLDFSSPNIAKPFSMGHLRSTVIGNALANISEKCGYKAVRINHLGDWGTQFGKLITAYKHWGAEEKVRENPIKELFHLYVTFHEEAEKHPHLEDEARSWFKQLEFGNKEASQLWKWFREESLKEFAKIYDLLDITFDSYDGEAFYNDKMDAIVQELEDKELLTLSEGAEVVDLADANMPPCLIKKKDGATLYATRDLAAAIYRSKTYHFEKSFYIVGQEQRLHFEQLFLVLQKMGYDWAAELKHVPFGFILKDGKKMSTRKGKVVLLEDVIKEAIDLAYKNIEAKNPALENKEDVAKMVGVGAIIFHDVKNERQNNIEFNLETMLKFEGSTGLYVQYTHARACSILRKAPSENSLPDTGLADSHSWEIVKTLMDFPKIIEKSFHQAEPSVIAKYVLKLSQEFNKYYSHVKVLTDDTEQSSRLALVKSVTIVLEEGLRLLGIKAPKKL
ncbi:arginine--tRNA ligase [Oceanobacillus jeddahense]|uniref:Arginine--tRNA ligase n=1 Tax=Oceanobacillus jeddahense TaxID=1462527 RepID=A0ABY5JQK7_9BACI|nr:arginine--tRNA ligase [Oceanobacillus jeddahense]UUI02089.1 arginine--tRNA ligase [Oceanobacillus jeddahense]